MLLTCGFAMRLDTRCGMVWMSSGHISDWQVSGVTDMSRVNGLAIASTFNEDLSKWDVSRADTMVRRGSVGQWDMCGAVYEQFWVLS